jgi:hypothetical protein
MSKSQHTPCVVIPETKIKFKLFFIAVIDSQPPSTYLNRMISNHAIYFDQLLLSTPFAPVLKGRPTKLLGAFLT